jgi:hypothetical protein
MTAQPSSSQPADATRGQSMMVNQAALHALGRLAEATMLHAQLQLIAEKVNKLRGFGHMRHDNPEARAFQDAIDTITSAISRVHMRATADSLAMGMLSTTPEVRQEVIAATMTKWLDDTSDSMRLYRPDGHYPVRSSTETANAWRHELSTLIHDNLGTPRTGY